jgi:hypothetical protein
MLFRTYKLEQQVRYTQGKNNVECLGNQEAVEWLLALHVFKISKPGLQPDADKGQVEPECAE